jgi:heterotetrameric sarcosine oxidase gamma subunit
VSAAERAANAGESAGVQLADCAADIVEIAALRNGVQRLQELTAGHAAPLPPRGHLGLSADRLILGVRPERWLLLCTPAAPGAVAQFWRTACGGRGVVVELTSALTALYVSGPAAREVLKRGCRLDLDPYCFPAGLAAATIIAQVPVVVAALASGMLLLTPASTARHFREWLAGAARPFGLMPLAGVTVASLSGEKFT